MNKKLYRDKKKIIVRVKFVGAYNQMQNLLPRDQIFLRVVRSRHTW